MSFSIKGIIKFLTILSIIITLLISIKNEYLNKPRLKTTVTHGVVTNYVPNSKLKPYYGLIELHFENLSDKPMLAKPPTKNPVSEAVPETPITSTFTEAKSIPAFTPNFVSWAFVNPNANTATAANSNLFIINCF